MTAIQPPRAGAARLPICLGESPIVFVSGVGATHRGWNQWVSELKQAGIYSAAVRNPKFGFGSLEGDLAAIDETVRGALAVTKARTVKIVGHSKGGIAAVEYLRRNPTLVDRVVAVASPHQGSGLASALSTLRGSTIGHALIPQMTSDLATGSQYVQPPLGLESRIMTIHASAFDGMINPTSVVPGSAARTVPGSTLWSARHDALRTHNQDVRAQAYDFLGVTSAIAATR